MQKPRPPIVAVVGHIDHGKSTLLDYIRHANIVEGEAGGITQHLSAYQATHENTSGTHHITFLDTPGHEAFKGMRSRGLEVADIAILIVSAEEGVKPQTKEAITLINEANIPFIVAFTKIDKPDANIERAKMSMLEAQIFLEGMGGEVPWVAVSGKNGEGIPELLDLIVLQAEISELQADADAPATGLVIESHVDARRGNTATLIVQNGTLKSGQFIVAGAAWAPTRIMENFLGKASKELGPSSPARVVGFSTLPVVGSTWSVVANKKEAESTTAALERRPAASPTAKSEEEIGVETTVLPLIIKTDVAGTGEAVAHELAKIPVDPRMEVRVLVQSVGAIGEGDVKLASGGKTPGIIVGFNVKVEREARDLAERLGVTIETFDIIYKLTEWLAAQIEERRPRANTEVVVGAAKLLKFFSTQKGRAVVGGRVEEGTIKSGAEVRIIRRDEEIGRGKIVGLQAQKKEVKEVEAGNEFGAMVRTDALPAAGDRLEVVVIEYK